MTEVFLWQAGALFWAAVCFFRVGAITKRIEATRAMWWEIGQAAVIVVLLFGLLTDGRGCSQVSTLTESCTAAGDC